MLTVTSLMNFRPPSDGGLMIPPWTKGDVLVKRLVIFFFYFFFCQENFMKNYLLGKFHAESMPVLGLAQYCLAVLGLAQYQWPR